MPLSALTLAVSIAAGQLVPFELRCESLSEPLAIDRTAPALSWKLRAAQPDLKNLRQTAYRILVASEPDRLQPGKADLWDSGRVKSSETYGIAYAGKPLTSGLACCWRVQSWDQDGQPSEWSQTATFTVGLLKKEDWKAQWIAIDAPETQSGEGAKFSGASWIWSSKDPAKDAPKVQRTFVKRFAVQDRSGVKAASLAISVDNQFTAYLNGRQIAKSDGEEDAWRRPVIVDLTSSLIDNTNELKIVASNDGPGYAGVLAKVVISSAAGEDVVVASDGKWIEEDGTKVQVIGKFPSAPWGSFGAKTARGATYYRKPFTSEPKLKRAIAYVTALGLVDLHLNGRRVSEDLFTPGWTDYDTRVYYRAFDVTRLIAPGKNVVGAVLGDGWFSGYLGYAGTRSHYGARPSVRVQLMLEYSDGSRQIVPTDPSWKASTGPITEQDFLMGESYDARLAMADWAKSSFDDAAWAKPHVVQHTAKLEAFPSDPVQPYATLSAKTVKEVAPKVYLLDYGQNLAGFARLRINGRPGQEITIRYGEWLNPDGTLYTTNLRGAKAIDHYICKGGEETWEPRFTFHGFQYAEITGLDTPPKADDVVAVAISSATPEVGKIETSDRMLNQLASNAWWTQKMNFIDIPTDCPQRDERLGWTGDAQAYIRTASTYSDIQAFFHKWLVALDDSQRADGQYPMVAPVKVAGDDGGPAWADAGVICPWTIYTVYGDKRQLAEHYPNMKRFIEFCRSRSTAELLPPAKFHCFGDWLSINAETPHEVIYEAYFAGSTQIVAHAAEALGKTDEAIHYRQLADQVRTAFNKAYVDTDGRVKGDTQCGYVLALAFDLLDKPTSEKAAAHLVADIEKRGWHLSTGFVGTRDLMHVLSKIGRNDVAFRLLHQTTFPSWKFEIVNGATSIWERWDGWTPEKGFQDPGMNSFAHYAYGAVMGWVFSQVGGIDYVTPGFETIKIAPQIDPNLTWVKTSYDSVRGPIRTEWRKENGKLTLSVDVPPNAQAEVHVPGGQVETVGSGTYRYQVDWKE